MGILAYVKVDLGNRVKAELAVSVDQQRNVDPVSGHEGQPLEQIPSGGDLAGQWLLDRR
jgi:hypothetical protein